MDDVYSRVLFKGSSCLELSPNKNHIDADSNSIVISNNGQFVQILKVLGLQNSENLSFLSAQK